MFKIGMGDLLQVIGANEVRWKVLVVDYFPDEDEIACVVPKEGGQAYVSKLAIHDTSHVRAKIAGKDFLVSLDEYWIAVGATRFEKAKIQEVEGKFQIVERKRRKRQPPQVQVSHVA